MASNAMFTGKISYDAFGRRMRIRNFGFSGNQTISVDQLMLFNQVLNPGQIVSEKLFRICFNLHTYYMLLSHLKKGETVMWMRVYLLLWEHSHLAIQIRVSNKLIPNIISIVLILMQFYKRNIKMSNNWMLMWTRNVFATFPHIHFSAASAYLMSSLKLQSVSRHHGWWSVRLHKLKALSICIVQSRKIIFKVNSSFFLHS